MSHKKGYSAITIGSDSTKAHYDTEGEIEEVNYAFT
jgi:hypothetical protein